MGEMMASKRFTTHKPGEWILPTSPYHFKCCGCGLVHVIKFSSAFKVTRAYQGKHKERKTK
jgi:hypothetical protein